MDSCHIGALLEAEQSEFPRTIAIESNARDGRIECVDDVTEDRLCIAKWCKFSPDANFVRLVAD